eukprot:CAMPEP_0197633590 /NCGR_PEP_ID=MMETSP1338-20131121/9926_1 /TAXON_ID=43686 ORGANISM="Pelagodinium beii, Strain RCC1491" /NCGR_SAMPLE_ID=MMETSP1338 /ASSEMBLY_ACC=CAM_ASM_000754 /LENGTH=111 /DNA_ID=CAMNT_0043205287 /DNA_START=16 /DNA_END=347 /DNA_ORIENTATION=-
MQNDQEGRKSRSVMMTLSAAKGSIRVFRPLALPLSYSARRMISFMSAIPPGRCFHSKLDEGDGQFLQGIDCENCSLACMRIFFSRWLMAELLASEMLIPAFLGIFGQMLGG